MKNVYFVVDGKQRMTSLWLGGKQCAVDILELRNPMFYLDLLNCAKTSVSNQILPSASLLSHTTPFLFFAQYSKDWTW